MLPLALGPHVLFRKPIAPIFRPSSFALGFIRGAELPLWVQLRRSLLPVLVPGHAASQEGRSFRVYRGDRTGGIVMWSRSCRPLVSFQRAWPAKTKT